jgi:hypothetical protein
VRVPGVAESLPAGERVLWQGAPRRALVARHVLHVRLAGVYFALTAGWWALHTAPAMPRERALPLLALQLVLGGVVLAMLHVYAAMTARGTMYMITTRRVVLRVGAVFPVVVNVPLAQVVAAGLHRFRDGSGQIALTLDRQVRASWWLLWPHARPTRLRWPEPLLRGLADPDAAAAALREAAACDRRRPRAGPPRRAGRGLRPCRHDARRRVVRPPPLLLPDPPGRPCRTSSSNPSRARATPCLRSACRVARCSARSPWCS